MLGGADWQSLEMLGRTCWKMRLLTKAPSLWREIVRETYYPPILDAAASLASLYERHHSDWRTVFINQPRVRFNGCYIAACHYARPGMSEDAWIRVIHVVEFYRSIRFLPDGTALSLLTTDAPSETVRKLEPGLKAKGFSKGRWELFEQGLEDDEDEGRPRGPKVVVEDLRDKSMQKYAFRMVFGLRSTTRGRWNKLDLLEYHSVNLTMARCCRCHKSTRAPFTFLGARLRHLAWHHLGFSCKSFMSFLAVIYEFNVERRIFAHRVVMSECGMALRGGERLQVPVQAVVWVVIDVILFVCAHATLIVVVGAVGIVVDAISVDPALDLLADLLEIVLGILGIETVGCQGRVTAECLSERIPGVAQEVYGGGSGAERREHRCMLWSWHPGAAFGCWIRDGVLRARNGLSLRVEMGEDVWEGGENVVRLRNIDTLAERLADLGQERVEHAQAEHRVVKVGVTQHGVMREGALEIVEELLASRRSAAERRWKREIDPRREAS